MRFPHPEYPEGSRSFAVGDFNGDGILDFVTVNDKYNNILGGASGTVSIRLGIPKLTIALTSTWLGISADWNTPGNWSTGKVPGNCTQVIVNSGVPYLPIVSGITNTCFSLLLNDGATIYLANDAKLSINGK